VHLSRYPLLIWKFWLILQSITIRLYVDPIRQMRRLIRCDGSLLAVRMVSRAAPWLRTGI
jgi:hypothetical protein